MKPQCQSFDAKAFDCVDHNKLWKILKEMIIPEHLTCSCFLHDPTNVGNLISSSTASLKHSLYFWNFSVHILLKPSLKDFKHHLASV